MNPGPIVPARWSVDEAGLPFSERYRDVYHPRSGAAAQARHVFLAGCGLPDRWRDRERFVVLETGFGLGNNFLATWQAWRDDPGRCRRLVFVSVEQHPFTRADLARAHEGGAWPARAAELVAAWPPLVGDLHRLAFGDHDDAGDRRVELLLAFGEAGAWLREVEAEVDAFFLDGFAPARNPELWDERVCKSLARLAAPDATLATWSAAGALRRGLANVGFEVRRAPGQGGKRDITLARYAPAFVPKRAPARVRRPPDPRRDAVVVGAGLAGCAAAWALAEEGWRCTVVDRADRIAAGASGNPAGLFHGIVHAADGPHARFGRHAASHLAPVVREALAAGVPGAIDGVLRLEHRLDVATMRVRLAELGLPTTYVEALDAVEASARAGLGLGAPAWFYPSGGWIDPGRLAAWFLARAGAALRTGCAVQRLARHDDGWTLLAADGRTIAEAAVVVLANADGAAALVPGGPSWPTVARRGQLGIAPAGRLALPRVPIAGQGYLLPRVGDLAVFGATSQPDDADPAVRDVDHAANLAQLERLLGRPSGLTSADLDGRTAWRCTTPDRLPLIGPVPDADAAGPGADRSRHLARPGLFVFAGLGSRGIAWSALGARILAATITGGPAPVERGLLDAVDPARFLTRAGRKMSAP